MKILLFGKGGQVGWELQRSLAPLGELVDIMDVGYACAYLATPFAHRITGGTVYVDGGTNIVA